MGLYERDYMRNAGGSRPQSVNPAVLAAVLVTLAAAAVAAKIGLGIHLPWAGTRPPRPAPVSCVGPSSLPCPPGSVRVRDPSDPDNPNEWPNDLHPRTQAPAV